jgi:hypothetical protein
LSSSALLANALRQFILEIAADESRKVFVFGALLTS